MGGGDTRNASRTCDLCTLTWVGGGRMNRRPFVPKPGTDQDCQRRSIVAWYRPSVDVRWRLDRMALARRRAWIGRTGVLIVRMGVRRPG
jgi:hypothetical protein